MNWRSVLSAQGRYLKSSVLTRYIQYSMHGVTFVLNICKEPISNPNSQYTLGFATFQDYLLSVSPKYNGQQNLNLSISLVSWHLGASSYIWGPDHPKQQVILTSSLSLLSGRICFVSLDSYLHLNFSHFPTTKVEFSLSK